ncbi:MAG TPA: AAA family ATPase [Pseudoxanthomonas sp.]|nr:AAA family ATPase [Pseudoxanthomonas sp.]
MPDNPSQEGIAGRILAMEAAWGPRIIAGAKPLLVGVDLTDFMTSNPSVADWALYPLIPRKFLTLLGAHGGAGKSSLALIWAAHMACGVSWCGLHPGGVLKTLFVSLEDSGDLVRYRLRRVCEAYRLEPALVEANVTVLDGTGSDGSLMIEANDYGVRTLCPTPVFEEVRIMAGGMDAIVVDNASDAYGGNEIERRSVRTFCRALSDLGVENNAAVLLLAHIDKAAARKGADGNSYSGSTAWHNSARSRLALIPQEDGSVELVHEKNNLGKSADTLTLGWSDHGVLMPRARDAKTVANNAATDAAAALNLMIAAHHAGITVPTGTSGSATSWHSLQHLPEMGETFQGKDGKRRLHAALLQLTKAGSITRAVYQDRHRNTRERWELTQEPSESSTESALRSTPIPPSATNARTGVRVSATDAPTNATNAAAYRNAKG